jgi:hypothetical protein
VEDVADVRLVDPHAERDGRDHDVGLVAREGVLVAGADRIVEPGVVGTARTPAAARKLGRVDSTFRR